MRILTSVAVVALIVSLPWTVLAAPFMQASIDIKALALTKADLKSGFDVVPDRTVSEERPDGVAVYDVTFARERTADNLSAGPFEVRSGVARTAQVDDAKAQLSSTKDAFVAEGWNEVAVPALGDEALGLTQNTDGEGGKLSHFSYLFRKGALILMVGVRGRPEVTKIDDAVSLAIVVSGRVDKALGAGGPPPPGPSSSGGPPAPAAKPGAPAERVKVVNVDGGTANVRSDPSTTADVVAEIAEGTILDIVGPNKDGDGRTWRNVKVSPTQNGWIVATLTETVSAPPAAPAPSPAPSPPAGSPPRPAAGPPPGPPPAGDAPPADVAPADSGNDNAAPSDAPPPPPPGPAPAASPSANSAPAAPSGGAGATGRANGNGITVDITVRDATLSSGKQDVKVKVTRNGGPVSGAFVDVTAKLDANRYRAIRGPQTGDDGMSDVEWDMEGPAGTYQVIVEVRTAEDGPATTATASFRWK